MNKENINLPKTLFSMKANLPKKELEIIKIWKKIGKNAFNHILKCITLDHFLDQI